MLGVKINEFDNSDGTIASFNKIFPMTPLDGDGYVEILDIVDRGFFSNNTYMRNIKIDGTSIEHDFGESNFYNNEDFIEADSVRFKYYAKDLSGNLLAKAYNCEELAIKLDCHVSVIKRRLISDITQGSKTGHLFNVTRKEL